MQKGTLFSTAYFPPLSYMAALVNSPGIWIEAHETFPKQTWRNRCTIATANGLQNLSVPVIKTNGNHTLTNEIRVCYSEKWQQLHWRALEAAYNKSPYFEYYKDRLEPILKNEHSLLIDLNICLLEEILTILELEIPIRTTIVYNKTERELTDMREAFSPKHKVETNHLPRYYQVFSDRNGYFANLSILDLLFCEGPATIAYLKNIGGIIPGRQS
jgi:hypothetical protein